MDINDPPTSYGECRCCLAKGHHRDITKEYYFKNIREVYIDIFMECFNLPLVTHKHISKLICSTCVQRLRNAISFRMMVVSTERQLLKAFSSKLDKATVYVNVPTPMIIEDYSCDDMQRDPKSESIKMEPHVFEDSEGDDSNGNILQIYISEKSDTKGNDSEQGASEEYDSKGGDSEGGVSEKDDSEETNSEEVESEDLQDCDSTDDEDVYRVPGEAELLARFAEHVPRALPTRCALRKICPGFVDHLDKLKDKIVNAKSIEFLLQKPSSKDNSKYVSEKLAHAVNATALFEHSNAIAFKTKMRNGYPCFYCRQIYTYQTLREHQVVHPKSILFKLFTKYTADCLVVYADVTDLKCTICNETILNINELKLHLTGKHNKTMYLDYPDRVIPFKLKEKDFECQVCGLSFETFGAVERHMNSHYGNFICEECGAGFVTKHRLGVHAYTLHTQGNFPCDVCKKNFPTQLKYKIHHDAVHRMLKKNKCPKCPEKFIDYFTRQKHLVDVHGNEPILYKCEVCDRAFNRRYTLSGHIKRAHLQQKDFKCQYCTYMCYTKTELRDHMVKHGGAKEFECSVCKKAYARKKAMILHMRIHSNDRRYVCTECGMSFLQNSTLKIHMKTHRFDMQT